MILVATEHLMPTLLLGAVPGLGVLGIGWGLVFTRCLSGWVRLSRRTELVLVVYGLTNLALAAAGCAAILAIGGWQIALIVVIGLVYQPALYLLVALEAGLTIRASDELDR